MPATLVPSGVPTLEVCEQLAPDEARAVLDVRDAELNLCLDTLESCVEAFEAHYDRALEAEATRP